MENNSVPTINFENVTFSYPSTDPTERNNVFEGMNFSVFKGQSVGLVGANGEGKSTLMSLLMGIYFPSEGKITYNGLDVSKKNLKVVRKNIGYVFQNSENQLFMNKVYDDVAFGPKNMGYDEAKVDDEVHKALSFVGAENLIERSTYRLSIGEKKRVAIAAVLAMHPEVIVMDEPTSSLDPASRRKLIDFLKTLPITKIIASHDLDMVYELCDETAIIYDGKIKEFGETHSILQNESLLKSCKLELPLSFQKFF